MPDVGTGYDVTLFYSRESLAMSSTFHYRETTSITFSQPTPLIATAWETKFIPSFDAIAADGVSLEQVYVRAFNPLGTMYPAYRNLGSGQGTAGRGLPTNSAAILTVASSDGSSRNNNRIFWGAVSQDDAEGNQLSQAALAGTYKVVRDLLAAPLNVDDGVLELAAKVSMIDLIKVDPPIASLSPFVAWKATLKNQRSRTSKSRGFAPVPI